ncbi:MAG: DUF2513 domain-containing protein [Methylococcales bacterium]
MAENIRTKTLCVLFATRGSRFPILNTASSPYRVQRNTATSELPKSRIPSFIRVTCCTLSNGATHGKKLGYHSGYSPKPRVSRDAEYRYGIKRRSGLFCSEQEVAYNMRLLSEAGYIKAIIVESSEGVGLIVAAIATRLTNPGHELLDTIRAESVWGKIKDTFKAKGVEMTFDLVISLGKKIAESLLLS